MTQRQLWETRERFRTIQLQEQEQQRQQPEEGNHSDSGSDEERLTFSDFFFALDARVSDVSELRARKVAYRGVDINRTLCSY